MRPGASYYPRFEDTTHRQPHFLDSCFLCLKPLSQKSDIYMYRGNTPFCSQECRQEQILTDEANEKRLKLSSSKRSSNTARQNAGSEKEFDSKKSIQSNTVAVS
ncbi:hypothetical protein F511_29414 [Dorcoceras hygrometricum]|uniref:FLZ-type domain-containing protein n=1 Tax=Dorcoceras hygrometricum TaxID=472368 RepID=A0A2Z7CEK4_9LAMI|nr:hypothetical protein F511_29414 [Dorcoceras hygrometricum]